MSLGALFLLFFLLFFLRRSGSCGFVPSSPSQLLQLDSPPQLLSRNRCCIRNRGDGGDDVRSRYRNRTTTSLRNRPGLLFLGLFLGFATAILLLFAAGRFAAATAADDGTSRRGCRGYRR